MDIINNILQLPLSLILICLIAIAVVVGSAIAKFLELPTQEKIEQIREWLIYAVMEAEKELGTSTGEMKLRMVYDWFLAAFPKVSKFMSFESFSNLVDEALEKFEEMLESNCSLKEYVYKEDK